MLIKTGIEVEVTGAVIRAPRLSAGGGAVQLTVAGTFERTTAAQQMRREVFYLPCVGLGPLAGRLSALGSGEAVHLRGVLCEEGGELKLLINAAVRLRQEARRLTLDVRGAPLLSAARQRVALRGVLVTAPVQMRLEDGQAVTNARVGLSTRAEVGSAAAPAPLVIVELAAYGAWGEQLGTFSKGQYVHAWGVWQRRKGTQAGQTLNRVEITDLEALHEARAII